MLIVLLVLSLTTTVVMAQKEDNQVNEDGHVNDNDELEGNDEQKMKREVKVKVEADKVEIESKLEKENITGEIENKFEVEFGSPRFCKMYCAHVEYILSRMHDIARERRVQCLDRGFNHAKSKR